MKKEPIFTRGFVFCFIALLSCTMAFYMLISISAEYAREFGADGPLQGLATSIYSIGLLVSRFLFSFILGKIGWKKMNGIFQPLHFASGFLYFFITDLPSYLLIRLIHGLFVGMATSAVVTTGTYHLAKSRYGEANGYLMTSMTLAIALGPFLAGYLYDNLGPKSCFTGSIVLSGIMWICLLLSGTDYSKILSDDSKQEHTDDSKGLNRLIEVSGLPIALSIFVSAFSYSSVLSFIRTYGQEMGLTGIIPVFFIVYAVVLIVSRPAAGRLQDRMGDSVILYPCIIMQFFCHLILGLRPGAFTVILSAVLCAAGYGSATACMNTIITRGLPAYRKSYAVNTYWVSCDLANTLGPVILGAVMESFGIRNMYITAAVISLFALVFYRFVYQRFKSAASHS